MSGSLTCQNIKIKTFTWAYEISWNLGSCQGPPSNSPYSNDDESTVQCCLAGGTYTLNCQDSYGDGWHGGYIQIGDDTTKYCENFRSGHLESPQITVAGETVTQETGKNLLELSIPFI